MVPAWRLYLTALEARLSSTCLSRWRSAWTVQVAPDGDGAWMSISRSAARGRIRSTVSLTSSSTSTGSGDSDRLPDSMREMSRTSLISSSRCRPPRSMWSTLSDLLLGEVVELEQLAEAEDGVERGAQLVAHAGEELALGPVGPVGLQLGLLEGLLGPPAPGDVGDHPHLADRPAVVVEVDAGPAAHPAGRLLGPVQPELDLLGPVPAGRARHPPGHGLPVPGVDVLDQGQVVVEGGVGDPEQVGQGRRPDHLAAEQVPVPVAHAGGVEGQAEALAAGPDGLLALAPLADVVGEGVEHRLRPRPDRPDPQLDREPAAVLVHRGHLDPPVQQRPLAGLQVALAAPVVGLPRLLGDDQLGQRPPHGLVPGPAEGLGGLGVPDGDEPGGVDRDEGLGGRLQDLPGPLLAVLEPLLGPAALAQGPGQHGDQAPGPLLGTGLRMPSPHGASLVSQPAPVRWRWSGAARAAP